MINLFLALRYLFRGKARHVSFIGVISCLGVILGCATVIVAMSIVNGIDGGLMDRVMRFKEHITVEAFDTQSLYQIKDRIKNWEDIDISYLCAETQVFVRFNEALIPVGVRGMEFSDPKVKELFKQYIVSDSGIDGVLIGTGLQQRYAPMGPIEFYPLQKIQKNFTMLTENVRGIFSVGLYDIDNYFFITDLEKARGYSEFNRVFLGIKVKQPFEAAKVKAKILEQFPQGLQVTTWQENNEALFATLKLEKIAMFIILVLIVLVASFNIFATLTVKVVEKTKDIGVLKSLGFTSGNILAVFTMQGLMLGIIGVAGGGGLGLGICYLLERYPVIRLPAEIFFTEYLPVKVNYFDVGTIAVIALAISFFSSLFPALRASRMPACEALRYE